MKAAVARVFALIGFFNCDPRRLSGFIKFLTSSLDPVELKLVEVVLD